MAGSLNDTSNSLRRTAAGVGRDGMIARSEALYCVHGDIERLAVVLGEQAAAERTRSTSVWRIGGALSLRSYRLARGLIGSVPPGWVALGDDIADFVEGGAVGVRIPAELNEVAEVLIDQAVGSTPISDAHERALWSAFDAGVGVAVAALVFVEPESSERP